MTHKNSHVINKTRKYRKIHGKILEEKEGWVNIHIYGEPYQRGYAHGYLLYKQMKRSHKVLKFLVKQDFKVSLSEYISTCKKLLFHIIKNNYHEIYTELSGISDGCRAKGIGISVDFLIASNAFLSMYQYYQGKTGERCSAFIAVGDATEDGKIVMAHNTHSDFASAQLLNISMKVTPNKGHEFTMQTSPGFVASSSDWFICNSGIIGCETTISSTNYKLKFGSPYFCRLRTAMQYCNNFDEYEEVLLKNNAGDYPCSWQFGNINTNEIMLLEIGLKTHSKKILKNGLFYGMNSVIDQRMRTLETSDTSFRDDEESSGSRNLRLDYLLNEVYYGKLNIENAKLILSDHYDSREHTINREGRCICIHYENDDLYGYTPAGCTDGKVVNSNLAKTQNYIGRFGSSCGRKFDVSKFVKKHPEHQKWESILEDFQTYKWTKL